MSNKTTELSVEFRREVAEIQTTTDVGKLVELLRSCLRYTEEIVIKMAFAAQRLEELGYDFDELPRTVRPVVGYLRKVAWGQLSAKLFVACMGSRGLMRRASLLPIPDQELIAGNETVTVLCADKQNHRKIPFFDLSDREVRQVLGSGKIRSLTEQRSFLEDEELRKVESGFEPPDVGFEIDRKRKRIVFTRNVILTAKELRSVLEQMK